MEAMIQGRRAKLENEDTNDGPNIGRWTSKNDFAASGMSLIRKTRAITRSS